MSKRVEKLKEFLAKEYPDTQAFNTANIAGDEMETVYEQDGITVLYATGWDYVEIFGLSTEEFESVTYRKEGFGSRFTLGGKE